MLHRFRHRVLLLAHAGIVASGLIALLLWPHAWPAVLVCVGGGTLAAYVCGRVARRYLNATLGRLRRLADDVGHGKPVAPLEVQPGRDLYKLHAALNLLLTRVGEAAIEEKRLQEELRRRERLAFLGELAATVAHEVNNPLDGIQNGARILRRALGYAVARGDAAALGDGAAHGDRAAFGGSAAPADPARAREMLDLIDGGLARIEQIVRRLLTLAREQVIRPTEVRLAAVLDGALATATPRMEGRGITLVRRSETEDDRTLVDPPLLEQVFVNLLLNAADSMPEGGELALTVRRDGPAGGELCVDVADTGAGIPAEVLPHIFEPFFTTKAGGKGTGLGLAIASRIVDAHQGTLTVAARRPRGTVFTVRLPAAGQSVST